MSDRDLSLKKVHACRELSGLPYFAPPEQALGMVGPSAPADRARQHISETCHNFPEQLVVTKQSTLGMSL
jgi:hypothetical protein